MPEYIDLSEARAFVEANYQGDPLLRHLYGTLLEKLPTVPDRRPMFLLKSAPADADILKTLASSPVIYSTGEETIIPLMPDRWIPVTERLPDKEFWEHQKRFEDEDLEVQVMIKGALRPTTLLYNAEGEFYEQHSDGQTFYLVTHWAPLMDPPKEVE